MIVKGKSKKENVLILGLGGVGYYLAKRLQYEGYAVTVIETDVKRIAYADSTIDVRIVQGEALSIACWEEAGAGMMDYLIAVTNQDAINMMAARIGHKYGIQHRIARVRSHDFGKGTSLLSAEELFLDLLIHPEELTAQEIIHLIKFHSGNEIINIAGGQIELLSARVHEESPFVNKTLQEIAREFDQFPFRVVAIARGITTIIPGGDQKICHQDQLFIMASRKHHDLLMQLAGVSQQRRQRVMILGGGLIGTRVAEILQKNMSVKLIEVDEKRAEVLSNELSRVEVLQGDGSEAEVLEMAGLKDVDTLIAATGENETNIMSCLLAKNLMRQKYNVQERMLTKTIALVNKEDYLVLSSSIGLDIALNKKIIAGNEILKYFRKDEKIAVDHLHGFDAEVVELIAAPHSIITRKPLAKMGKIFGGQILIGGVFRGGKWNIAVGNTQISDQERVVVICTSHMLKEVRRIFA